MLPRILKSSRAWRRCFCDKPPVATKDLVYQTFLDKVREYRLKSPTGKPFEPTPEYEEELKVAIEKLALRYGGGEGVDMLAFPKFILPDLNVDPISIYDLPEYKGKDINEDPEKEAKPEGEVKEKKGDKKAEDTKKEAKSKSGVKDNKAEKGKNEEKAKKAKDDKKAKPKDEKDKK